MLCPGDMRVCTNNDDCATCKRIKRFLTKTQRMAKFTYDQLRGAVNEVCLKIHEMDETNRLVLSEDEIFQILLKWTKKSEK